ncbi:hypothetical protein [Candidatus Accumulibacter phosphatis]|uniref:hypothetical protein n=1 Tax=Candidatus Accumulibacter phosphatis TaxID=327160 RepID=UPI003C6CBAB3
MEKYRLAAVPFEPAQTVEQGLGKKHHHPAPVVEQPRHGTGIHRFVLLVQTFDVDGNCLGLSAGRLIHDLSSDQFQNYTKR